MMTSVLSSQTTRQEKNLFNTISWTALLAGTLHIAAATGNYYLEKETSPIPLFQFIASGIFGKEAFTGGTLMIIWGIVFHFMIAFALTLVLFLIYPKIISWLKNKFITGIIYGLSVWTIMNKLIIPFSNTPKQPFDLTQAITAALILICTVGVPVVLMAHRYYFPEKKV
jgi:hypothetical protein